MAEQLDSVESAVAGSDAPFDPAVALSRRQFPSSIGLTFAVDPVATPRVTVRVAAARYVDESDGKRGGPTVWTRVPASTEPVTLIADAPGATTVELTAGLDLRTVVRPRGNDGKVAITLALVNSTQAPARGQRDHACWFQPSIEAVAESGAFHARRSDLHMSATDEEVASYALLYRNVQDYAVGHGCGGEWDTRGEPVTRVATTFIPRHAVPLAEPSGRSDVDLTMSTLATVDGLRGLDLLLDDYAEWIDRQRHRVSALDHGLRSTAQKHIAEADQALARMRRGLALLREDAQAMAAFSLMNRAMELQRERQDKIRSGAAAGEQSWRPFQIAFVLLNLEGLTDPESPERQYADLLWFPTGGGKTEAYLGLIAYTIMLRRLRNPSAAGVSVLMRYTLRLLTIQQFERAAGLICALESLRRRELESAAPISLGLWVGRAATPNNVDEAKRALKSLRKGEASEYGNPRQLVRCPACGRTLSLGDYQVVNSPDRLRVSCPNASCEFSDGLPVYLTDSDVYRARPSLVIGTVDKFAMMAWRQESSALFSTDGSNPPPDLIVQDELHLISGPLGTMVGLYETAVDAACSRPHRPKVVASTATIRRATEQVRAVFNRAAKQFPPSGLDADDSYFATQASPDDKGDRLYVGLMAPATSHATLMVRTYAALLNAAASLEGDDAVRDTYWTLLGYFNSLRVLGGAYMQVQDDVPDRLKLLASRHETDERVIDEVPVELTSRVSSADVPQALDQLGTSYPSDDSPDVVLATNMISVGVDVDRLGLMAMMGQPQTTAEYIQATSRVGRKRPGLVVTLYNAARSRDLSHYELFVPYHQALYRQVEATGATPFAARARDRALHGVLVSLARNVLVEGAPDGAAGSVPAWKDSLDRVARAIVDRARAVEPDELEPLQRQLDTLIARWVDAAENGQVTKYPGWKHNTSGALLQEAGVVVDNDDESFPVDEPPWPTMTSLRDVDSTSGLYLVPTKTRKNHG